MATHLKEGKPETLHDLADRAETYLEAHSSDILFGVDPKFSKIRGSLQPKRCHNCGSPDHLRNQRLLRIQEYHSIRLDHQVRSRNHQATLPSSPLHLDGNHLGLSSITRLDTLLETADQSSPLPWNTRVTTVPTTAGLFPAAGVSAFSELPALLGVR